MRVLILTITVLAYAAAAPSGIASVAAPPAVLAPLGAPLLAPALAIPAVVPTLSPGDLQAAAINAKVAAEDQARALADKAIEETEKVIVNQSEKVMETTDVVKEKSEEAFWANEDKKWQALDAVNTAQAKLQGSIANIEGTVASIEGSVASNAEMYAKSALQGAIVLPGAPLIAPIVSPIVYAGPGILAPVVKTPEMPSPDKVITEVIPVVKAAELPSELLKTEMKPEPTADIKTNEIATEKPKEGDSPDIKTNLKLSEEKPITLPLGAPLLPAPLAFAPGLKIEPWLAPVAFIPPGLKSYAITTFANGQSVNGQVLAPTIIKTEW